MVPLYQKYSKVTYKRGYNDKDPFKKYVTHLEGRGLSKKITKCDIGGRGVSQRVMSLLRKYIVSKFAF